MSQMLHPRVSLLTVVTLATHSKASGQLRRWEYMQPASHSSDTCSARTRGHATPRRQPYIRNHLLVLVHFCPRLRARLWSYPPTLLRSGMTRASRPPGWLGGPRNVGFVVQASTKASRRITPPHGATPGHQRATSDNQQLQCTHLLSMSVSSRGPFPIEAR